MTPCVKYQLSTSVLLFAPKLHYYYVANNCDIVSAQGFHTGKILPIDGKLHTHGQTLSGPNG